MAQNLDYLKQTHCKPDRVILRSQIFEMVCVFNYSIGNQRTIRKNIIHNNGKMAADLFYELKFPIFITLESRTFKDAESL